MYTATRELAVNENRKSDSSITDVISMGFGVRFAISCNAFIADTLRPPRDQGVHNASLRGLPNSTLRL
jgi:hypothetical protein